MSELHEQVTSWIDSDVDLSAQDELRQLAQQAQSDPEALAELEDRFAVRLQFGTAGLRGAMGAGPNRMNRAVVIQAAHGLITYLKENCEQPIVVIGNDARHQSRQFALDTAGVVMAAGGQAVLLPDALPTPLLAFAVRHLGADAGVMVTASHNPAADNGYKVYLGGRMVPDHEAGVQIVAPHDSLIAQAITLAPPANQIPLAQGWDTCDDIQQAYIETISTAGEVITAPLRIVYTAMHGVGAPTVQSVLNKAGFTDVVCVKEQQNPDPDFPTVVFPNPEEPGALDMAIELAQSTDADLIIASDPDADRCAVAVLDPRQGWRILHGDELGAILGESLGRSGRSGVYANSLVSSRQLEKIATHYGNAYSKTLTGFKWMGRVENLGFAYEEAIGYCVRPDLVRDKDGISTALEIARLASELKKESNSLMWLLDDLARRNGLYLSSQLSVRFDDLSQIPQVMVKLRDYPMDSLAGSRVTQTIDLAGGWGKIPPTDGILMLTEADDQVVVRPSGTEPKVKCYLEVIEPVDSQASFEELSEIRARAGNRLELLKTDLQSSLFT